MANHYIRNEQVGKGGKKQAAKSKGRKSKSRKSGKPSSSGKSLDWIHNRNVQVIAGWFLLFFTIFLFAAFCSFFNTHAEDITLADSNLFKTLHNGKTSTGIGNRLGIFGLYFSFLFIRYGFGIASFGFLFLFALWSIYLIWERPILPLVKAFAGTCLCVIWFSLLMGGLFGKNSRTDWLGGNIGNTLSEKLIHDSIGHIGFLLLLIFLAIVILVIFFGMTFSRHIPSDEEDEDGEKTSQHPKGNIQVREVDNMVTKEEKGTDSDPEIGTKEKKISVITRILHPKKEGQPAENDPFNGPKRISHTYPPANPETSDATPAENAGKEAPKETSVTEKTAGTPVSKPTDITVTEVKGDEPEFDPEEITDETGTNATDETEVTEIKTETPQRPGPDATEKEIEEYLASLKPFDPRDELIHFKFPEPELLEAYSSASRSAEEREQEIRENKVRIQKILSNFGVEIQSISAIEGPTVTMYEIVPAPGVRISKIKNLEDDIALSVAAIGIRIIAPIPGKGTVGIEVPNSAPKIVPMRDMVTSEKFQNAKKMALPIAIGRTISNDVYVFDLAKTPHVLMAGATGQGKSVGLNAVLTSLLYYKHPSELKLVLVDPKKVELTLYSKIERHYLAKLPDAADAIITDTSQVVRTLNSLCIEMDNRYELLKKAQCRNIIEYNEKFVSRHLNPDHGHRYLPYIVLIFDEFADCIMTAGREVESPVARLAQLARAIGIHLIVATQRPSVNIITGVIKANFPARIAFRVSSSVDSR
ncbi:MAG: DNA translocase FtsK 4TM domain-containing protein, partial [Bacteroidales bacterium]|nr:DNA translocase FtsK 4TM domain-containing protein [Bacteroidales bacterium]